MGSSINTVELVTAAPAFEHWLRLVCFISDSFCSGSDVVGLQRSRVRSLVGVFCCCINVSIPRVLSVCGRPGSCGHHMVHNEQVESHRILITVGRRGQNSLGESRKISGKVHH